jgi:hypothetical protein
MLTDNNEELRALAGYVLAISGDSTGLKPLLAYWQAKERDDDAWVRLVYQAIAATNDGSYLPVLMQVYKGLNDWEVNNFYWTIRNMTAPKVLEFRKRIRKEKGEHLN